MSPATVSFWFEYASPYSMVSALRLLYALSPKRMPLSQAAASLMRGSPSCEIPDLSETNIVFRPISLGAVFKAAGQMALPNMAVPLKASYLFHDVARSLDTLGQPGFPLQKQANWPPNSTTAGRLTWMLTQGTDYINSLNAESQVLAVPGRVLDLAQTKVIAEWVWRVYEAQFIAIDDIGSPEVLAKLWDLYVYQPSKLNGREVPEGQMAVELAQSDAVKGGFKDNTQEAIDNNLFGAPSFTTEDNDMYWGNDRLFDALAHHNIQDTGAQKTGGFCVKAKGANL
ncbi:hypothetical protein GGI19_006431 [Coemansia pectinata]|uniref:DSBA-like thioredoxin domain-containing protein n=1 Tax=Coemansia pectinata TaxID=1052879 RepID=A0A9W8GU54_9FUNG|nr:hypothetical protein GGI19_006431 [Coemansia pectinata]